ncbi:MAG: hypothetical protein HYX92_00660 [Chloroflexi bacterium]|nr:hypothetical protein [Chloroflexota bacterium]
MRGDRGASAGRRRLFTRREALAGAAEAAAAAAMGKLVYSMMAATKAGMLVRTPRRIRFSVISRNQRSTRFSHDADVGVKCLWKRGCFASQAVISRSAGGG